jgi:MFS family permease
MIALVQASMTAPVMVFSLAAGALADSFDRRVVMLIAQAGMMLASCCLVATAFLGLLDPWLLLGFTFLIGCGTALFNPSWQASIGDIVSREDLPAAVTLNSMGFNMVRSVGPAVGGLIVALAGAVMAFLVNALSYLAMILALLWWKPPGASNPLPREGFGSAMWSGLRYAALSPHLMTVLARAFLFGLSAICLPALLPSVASEHSGGGAVMLGTLMGCFGLGAIGGGAINGWMRDRFSNEAIVRLACILTALNCVVLGFSRNPVLSHLAMLPGGASWVLAWSLFNVSIQLSSPRWVVGRTLALNQTATFGGMALGSWIWGLTADAVGLDWALLAAGAALLGCALFGLRIPVAPFGSLDLDPLDGFKEPLAKLDLEPRSGPIEITTNYHIAQEDVPRFLALMASRRRIRIRDGARHWTLSQNIEQPELWVESYCVPTWVDYVRHNLRRTRADGENISALREMHRGDGWPRVHRLIKRQP